MYAHLAITTLKSRHLTHMPLCMSRLCESTLADVLMVPQCAEACIAALHTEGISGSGLRVLYTVNKACKAAILASYTRYTLQLDGASTHVSTKAVQELTRVTRLCVKAYEIDKCKFAHSLGKISRSNPASMFFVSAYIFFRRKFFLRRTGLVNAT